MYQFIVRIKNFLQQLYLNSIRYFTSTNVISITQVTVPAVETTSPVLFDDRKPILDESNPVSLGPAKSKKKKNQQEYKNMGKKNKKQTQSIILENLERTSPAENTKEEILFDDYNDSVQEEAKIKAELQQRKNQREAPEKVKSVSKKGEASENRFLITHKADKEIHEFDKANQHYLKIDTIYLMIKKNGYKNIDKNTRRQLHFHCLCLLEELKALEPQMSYPSSLAKRIKLLRNIFAKRKDCFFGNHAVIEDFISAEESSLLKIVLNTFDHTRYFIKTNSISKNFNLDLLLSNGICANVLRKEINKFDLPKESPLAYLLEIKDLIGNELSLLMRTSPKDIIELNEFLKNSETQINVLSIVIEIAILAITFRNYYPELCRDDSKLNLSLKEGMLLLTLDTIKNKEEKLKNVLNAWPFSQILAACIEVRNVYCHQECEHKKVERIEPNILFYLTGKLYTKVLPELKKICGALEQFEALYETPGLKG